MESPRTQGSNQCLPHWQPDSLPTKPPGKPLAVREGSLSFLSLDCDAGPRDREGAWPDSLVRDGHHAIEELPWDALQDDVPEADVVQHLPGPPVNHHHLDAIFCQYFSVHWKLQETPVGVDK